MKHLLDLNDLLEEELGNIYNAEKWIYSFLTNLETQISFDPLLFWVQGYKSMSKKNSVALERLFYSQFIIINNEKLEVLEQIKIKQNSSLNRIYDEQLQEELMILTLIQIIHYMIARYQGLFLHAKTLHFFGEIGSLKSALGTQRKKLKELEALAKSHFEFMNEWA